MLAKSPHPEVERVDRELVLVFKKKDAANIILNDVS